MRQTRNMPCTWIMASCALLSFIICSAALFLWHRQPDILTDLLPNRPVMAPNSAIAMGIASFMMLISLRIPSVIVRRRMAIATGIFLVAVGGSCIWEFFTRQPLWLNHIYFDSFLAFCQSLTQKMRTPSPYAGLGILLLGAAFISWCQRFWITQVCVFLILLLSGMALAGYVYGVKFYYQLPNDQPLSGMALPTAVSLAILSIGILFSKPSEGIIRLVLERTSGGEIIKRLGVALLSSLLLFGSLSVLDRRGMLEELPGFQSTFTVILIGCFFAVLWSCVRALENVDEERRRVQALLQLVIESLPVGVWILHRDGTARSVNPASQKIWEGKVPDLNALVQNEAWCDRSGHKLKMENWAAARALHHGETVIGDLVRIRIGEGKERFILSSAIPLRDEKGSITGAVMVHEDITEQKRAEVNAKGAEARSKILLERANEAIRVREDVLSIVSHDLKNPLTSANLGIQLLQRHIKRLADTAGLERTAANVQKSINSMKILIQSILDLGKIQSGTFAVDPEAVAVKNIFQSLEEVMQSIARDKGVKLTIEQPEDGCRALCDQNRVIQVLMNLVGNALKFTPNGGAVRVSCAHKDSQILFTVTDTGPGIPSTQLLHIFERNWQAPSTAASGQGLGLFIAKGIVEAHEGKIWAESVLGRGSSFYFTIPAAQAKELESVLDRQTGQRVEGSGTNLGGGRIYVAKTVDVATLHIQPNVFRDVKFDSQAGHTR